MPRENVSNTDEAWLWAGSPNGGIVAENYERSSISADLAALTTQVMLSVGVPLQAGETITSLSFLSGATAAGTPTNYWAALYDTAGVLMAQSADALAAAWAADTAKTFTLSTVVAASVSGIYYAAGVIAAGQKVLAQTSGSALVGTAPGTIATPTTVVNVPYVALR